jgi:Tol biopolymer transport system component
MRDALNGFAPECSWFSGAKTASSIGVLACLPFRIRWLGASRHCGVVRSYLLLIALFAVGGLTGCSGEGSPGSLHFSPDGSIIAYTYVKRIDLPLPPELPTIYSTVYLQWCRSDQLKECRSLKIESYGKSYGSFVQNAFLLMFSPDSKQLAVKSPRCLEVVDLATMTRRQLTGPDESVGSIGWLGNKEMVYSVFTKPATWEKSYGVTHRIFRHSIGEPSAKRSLLYEQTNYEGLQHDYVSPTGEHVVFMSQGYPKARFLSLNTQTGEVIALSKKFSQFQGVSWKPDGSCVFCLSSREAVLWYPKEGRRIDLSEEYDNSFRRFIPYKPDIDERWTPDGEYIVINSSKTGGCLVRPGPWQVVPVGKRLMDHLEQVENLRVYRDSPDDYPYIFTQPYPGWTRVWIQIATEKKPEMPGQTVVLEPRNYLVDDEAGRFLFMQSSDTPGSGWSLSPDGQKIVYFNRSLFLDEKHVSMPTRSK